MIQIKFQPNIPSHSEEKVDFIGFAIFSIDGHLDHFGFFYSEAV